MTDQDKELRERLRVASIKHEKDIEKYFANDMRELKRIMNIIITKKFPYYDEDTTMLVNNAADIFYIEVLGTFDEEKGNFDAHVYSVLNKKTWTWINKHEAVRKPGYFDGNGNRLKQKDENGKERLVRCPVLRIDQPINNEDGSKCVHEVVSSGYSLERDVIGELEPEADPEELRVELFKKRLSRRQREFVDLVVDGKKRAEIMDIMGIGISEYVSITKALNTLDNLILLNGGIKTWRQ